jgi:uncharacterized membrane protein (UPF0127 family)
MKIIEQYLSSLNKSDMSDKLSKYNVVTFTSPEDIKVGMLRFNKPPEGKCFLFILVDEEIASFHTIDMKFPIDIFFYNEAGKLDSSYLNVKPGVKSIKSKNKVKYVIETPS